MDKLIHVDTKDFVEEIHLGRFRFWGYYVEDK